MDPQWSSSDGELNEDDMSFESWPVNMDSQWGASDGELNEDDMFFESWPVKQRT